MAEKPASSACASKRTCAIRVPKSNLEGCPINESEHSVMKNESLAGVVIRLREAGYRLVQTEVRILGTSRLKVDVLGWAGNDEGALVPQVAVQVKRSGRPEISLPILEQAQRSLGTVDHYVVTDQGWFTADKGLRSVKLVDGPAHPNTVNGEVRAIDLASTLLRERVLKATALNRIKGRPDDLATVFDEVLSRDGASTTIETASGEVVAVDPMILWKARRAVWNEQAEASIDASAPTTLPMVSDAIASLVGKRLDGTVLDPFCGSGGILWAVGERAISDGRTVELVGRDHNPQVLRIASLIGAGAPFGVGMGAQDSLTSSLPEADVIVTAPQLGARLSKPYVMENGLSTRQVDLAAVDASLRALKSGGRAVFQLSAGFTFQNQAAKYRDFLSSQYRVAALIGCPAGSIPGSRIKSVLMVIDKTEAGDTFVAQLADDWRSQLVSNGPMMAAALAHIDSGTEV